MKNDNPLFSIIITSYNQESYIERTIQSVLSQSFKDFEIIIVDDCSTDDTAKIITAIKSKDDRITFIKHKDNKSVFISRIDGVQQANGKYILFLDGDDTYFENALEQLEKIISNEEFDVCEFSYFMSLEKKVVNPIDKYLNISRLEYFSKNDINFLIWNKFYRTEILKKSFTDIQTGYMNIAEDWYQSICIACHTKKYLQKNILVYNYNTEAGITAKKYTFEKNKNNFDSIKCVLFCINNLLQKETDSELKNKIIENIEAQLYSWAKVKVKYQTEKSDVIKSYLLLSKIFDEKSMFDDFSLLYQDAHKYRDGYFSFKNFARRIYHKIKGLL